MTLDPTQDDPPPWPEPVGARVGAGGFATVWELPGGRVLKLAHASHELARARIAREAEALRAIGAPAVPRLHDTGVLADGRAWLVAERIAGPTLADLAAAGPVPLDDALLLGAMLAEALERVHAARFVHRDVKPANAVHAPDGRVVLLDLGLARKLPDDPDDPTRAGVQVGSLEYIAPEQLASSSAVDERSDLYAFGCVLFALLAGRPPFAGDAAALERAHAALRPPRLSALVSVPPAVEALVRDCLAKEPARRPGSAAIARARLASCSGAASMSLSHSRSMIREGTQPVVLLWAELPRVDRALLGLVSARRLVVASQRGRRVLAGVLGGDHADPAGVAVAAARELAAAGARVALHLDALRVGPVLEGEAIERPETWLPASPWTGVIATAAFASVTQAPTRPSALDGFRELAGDDGDGELFGRDALLTDLAADAAAGLAAGPGFAVLYGEPGSGKSAVARELARRIAELGARVHLASVPPPGAGRPAHAALAELVGTPAPGEAVRVIGDALRAAARAQPTAVILDDLHHADHELLDALEYATLGGERLPLWLLGIAAPRLDARRPELGRRAERARRDVLPPLDEDAAVALAAARLKPAEYPPLRALRRLAAIARGNPLHLAMLAREIHERGAIRARPGGAPYLDTTALDDLQPVALGPWLAARELATLPPELAGLARVCAVVGGELARDELVAIVEAVERRGGATTPVDVDVGLGELVRAGLLVATPRGHAFRQALVEEGVYATTDERERLAIHEAALEHGLAAGEAGAEAVARHAEAVGAHAAAAAAFAQLGARASREHRPLDADQAWSGALRHLPERDVARGRALLGRASARYGLQRVVDALADVDAAIACARATCDAGLELDALLLRATVLDWAEDFAGSAAAAGQARERLAAAPSPEREAEVRVAEARAAFRAADQGAARHEDAAAALHEARAAARRVGRADLAAIAGVLLGPTLAWLHDPGAAAVFEEVIADCEAAGDRLHLGAAFANRAWLWGELGEVERTAEDLRRVIQIARELGQASLERIGTHNLAEELLWQGGLDEALPLARRCLAIQRAHGEGSTQPDRVLLARILAARDDRAELAAILETFAHEALGAEDAAIVTFLRGEWDAALGQLEALPPPIRIELAHLARRHGRLDELRRAPILELARAHPIWRRRLAEL